MNAIQAWRVALKCLVDTDLIYPLDRREVRPLAVRQFYRVECRLPNGERVLCEVTGNGQVESLHVFEPHKRGSAGAESHEPPVSAS